jgi:hypothetical protein
LFQEAGSSFYEYLAALFEFYVQLRRTKQEKTAATLIAKLFGPQDSNAFMDN